MDKKISKDRFKKEESGPRLLQARAAAGFSSAGDASKVYFPKYKEFHKQNLEDKESGRRGISPYQAHLFAEIYQSDPWFLLSGITIHRESTQNMRLPTVIEPETVKLLFLTVVCEILDAASCPALDDTTLNREVISALKTGADLAVDNETEEERFNRFRRAIERALRETLVNCGADPVYSGDVERGALAVLGFLVQVQPESSGAALKTG